MYNGIGLQTARGSGTNGYVTRNIAFIRHHKDKVDYKSEEELKKLDAQMNKKANVEILDHERKRKVELKCIEMQELMEEQGYSAEEIQSKVSVFRKMLMEKEGVSERSAVERDENGRPIAKETHQLAEANQAKNDRIKAAFGISEYFVEGSSFDPERKAKEEAAKKAAEMAKKKYAIVRSSSSSPSPSPERKRKSKKSGHKSRKKHKRDHSEDRSESPSPERKSKKRKHKKHRRDDSEDRSHKKKKSKKSSSKKR